MFSERLGCGSVLALFFFKPLGIEVDVLDTFHAVVVLGGGTSEVALLFGGCYAVPRIVND